MLLPLLVLTFSEMDLFKLSLTLSKNGPFWTIVFFLISRFQFAVSMWGSVEKKTSEESTSLLCESDYELFISEEACWSVWECKILRALHWDTKGCHWLAMTFSLMAMTFYLSQCACSCRWLWESVELSDSKVKKKEKETFHQIFFVTSDNYISFNNTCFPFS